MEGCGVATQVKDRVYLKGLGRWRVLVLVIMFDLVTWLSLLGKDDGNHLAVGDNNVRELGARRVNVRVMEERST